MAENTDPAVPGPKPGAGPSAADLLGAGAPPPADTSRPSAPTEGIGPADGASLAGLPTSGIVRVGVVKAFVAAGSVLVEARKSVDLPVEEARRVIESGHAVLLQDED